MRMSGDMNGHGHAWEHVNTNGEDSTDAHAEHEQHCTLNRDKIRLEIRIFPHKQHHNT